ncbi:MAG: glycosyltransferase family 2 protein [Brevinematales bacterium]|nr:glycosyltransferase family 2 protein [Brevinematales bacterium]
MLISVIIPCYNEEEVINATYERLKKVFSNSKLNNYEFIFINDGSKDKTLELLTQISQKDKNAKVISFSRNFGHQCAVSAGINECNGDVAIIIDADLQDPPELIPEIITLYEKEKANVIYCVRKERKGETFFKKFTAEMFYKFLNMLSEVNIPLNTGDFRLIDKNVIETFKKMPERNKFIRGMISWIGFKQIPFYYVRDPRLAGETKYPLKKMLKFAFTGIFYFSKKPLKLAINLGFISILVGIFLSLYALIGHFSGIIPTVPGWASIMITVIFFGGIQLLTIGVLGEYIGNIFDEVKKRPEYIIEKKINFEE